LIAARNVPFPLLALDTTVIVLAAVAVPQPKEKKQIYVNRCSHGSHIEG